MLVPPHVGQCSVSKVRWDSETVTKFLNRGTRTNIRLKTFHPTNSSPSNRIRHLFNLSKHHQTPRLMLTSAASVLLLHKNVKYCTFLNPSSLSLAKTRPPTILAHQYSSKTFTAAPARSASTPYCTEGVLDN